MRTNLANTKEISGQSFPLLKGFFGTVTPGKIVDSINGFSDFFKVAFCLPDLKSPQLELPYLEASGCYLHCLQCRQHSKLKLFPFWREFRNFWNDQQCSFIECVFGICLPLLWVSQTCKIEPLHFNITTLAWNPLASDVCVNVKTPLFGICKSCDHISVKLQFPL